MPQGIPYRNLLQDIDLLFYYILKKVVAHYVLTVTFVRLSVSDSSSISYACANSAYVQKGEGYTLWEKGWAETLYALCQRVDGFFRIRDVTFI